MTGRDKTRLLRHGLDVRTSKGSLAFLSLTSTFKFPGIMLRLLRSPRAPCAIPSRSTTYSSTLRTFSPSRHLSGISGLDVGALTLGLLDIISSCSMQHKRVEVVRNLSPKTPPPASTLVFGHSFVRVLITHGANSLLPRSPGTK